MKQRTTVPEPAWRRAVLPPMVGILPRLGRGALILLAFALTACGGSPEQASASGPRVYVTNEMSGDLTIIDPEARQVVGRVALGKRPRGIIASPDGRLLYIALSGSPVGGPGVDESSLPPADKAADGIAVLDIATQRVLRVIKGISDPETVAISPDGARLFVASEDTGQLIVIDANNGRVMAQLPVGGEPEGTGVSPDGRIAIATSEADHSATIIDAAALRVLGRVEVGERPRNILFLGGRAFIPGEGDASLTAIDPQAARALDRTIIAGDNVRPMGIVAAGGSIFLTTGRGGELVRLDPHNLSVTGRVRVGARPWGVAASPDGRLLFTANGPSNDVAMVDAATLQVVARFPAGDRPWGVVMVAPH
jgi:YVTN family beta-propeller protein